MSGTPAGFRTFRSSGWARRQPRTADLLRAEGAAAARRAIHCRAATAANLGRSVDAVDRIIAGHESSAVYRHDQLIAAVQNPMALVAHARAVTLRIRMQNETTDELVRRWREITNEEEHRAQFEQDRASYTADADEAAEADEKHAAVLLERSAIRRLLNERGVDPRKGA